MRRSEEGVAPPHLTPTIGYTLNCRILVAGFCWLAIQVEEILVVGNFGGWKSFGGFLAVDRFGGFVLISLMQYATIPKLGILVVGKFDG